MLPRIRSGCTLTKRGHTLIMFVSIFEIRFSFPSRWHSTVCFQRECRFLHAVWVLCTTWPSQSIKTTWPVLLCESLTPEYCICIPSGLDLIQATISGFPSGVQQRSQIHTMICQPRRARALLFLWSSETWKIYLGFFIPDPSQLYAPAF